jgi:amino acid adenylation domain-containing protein
MPGFLFFAPALFGKPTTMTDTITDFPITNTLVELFEEQVLRTPDLIAVEFEGEALRYRELNRRANQFANYLQKKGIGKNTIVAVQLDRSPKLLISLLAIMKTGAAYLPVDPSYPAERVKYMIADSAAHLILAENGAGNAHLATDAKIYLNLNKEWADILQSEEIYDTTTSVTDLAYLLYTSGSTGKPKGVQVDHGNLANFLLSMKKKPGMKAEDRMLAITTISFDIAGLELFLPLICGAVVVLAGRDTARDGAALLELIRKKNITIAQATPATWYMLLDNGWNTPLNLKALCGGEAFPRDLAAKLLSLTNEVWNMYGPTETTIWSSIKQITRADEITIGKPIDHTTIYILDADRRQVEPGESGEIFIGGKGVSRGYLNRDELTKATFIRNPFSDREEIIYQTGDEGKQLPNGDFVCLGRLDQQIKLRGFRIELGEIENVLLELEHIKKAVVVVSERAGIQQLVAYVVASSPIGGEKLRSFMSRKLPEYMIPNSFVEVAEFPLTPNGKIDRKNLPDPAMVRSITYKDAETDVEASMLMAWKEALKLDVVGVNDNFFELGGNSLLAQKVSSILLGKGLLFPVTKVYQYPTISQAAGFLAGDAPKRKRKKDRKTKAGQSGDVAVIAMAGRFPGADSIEELWNNLKLGKEGVHFFSDEELEASVKAAGSKNPSYIKARGILRDADKFDPAFFGMNLRTAELMDPQQRVFLEICSEAMEIAGLAKNTEHTVGVFAGASHNSYYTKNLLTNPDAIESVGEFQVLTLNDKDYLSSRVAYALNLNGPAVTVQSACSTSLLAISQAVESIRAGHCELALAGGVAINPPFNRGHIYYEGAMFSKDGHTRAFDRDASGTVFSDGAGVVLLKDKEEAESDGDTIYAVIKGIGVNNDGSHKGSFTAPDSHGQSGAISLALRDAGVEPSDISYIEAHGTGTPVGDPIELEGLKQAFGPQEKKHFCSVGSIKSNIGHLTVAAGVAGFIKTCLSLYHKQIPPSINFQTVNPLLEIHDSPFYINKSLSEWKSDSVRRAGVSSFGIGGTNVHVVLEEHASPSPATRGSKPFELIRWSAKSPSSNSNYAAKLSHFIDRNPDCALADVAYTLSQKADFHFRSCVIAADMKGLSTELIRSQQHPSDTTFSNHGNSRMTFIFPGQGAQYLHMGREMYRHEAVFRNAVDECAALLKSEMGEDIREVMYSDVNRELAAERLQNTYYTQPAIFITEYALAKTWMKLGIKPSLFLGHSVGEFVAAHLAGVFSLKDALYLIASRAKLMADLPKGSMLAVRMNVDLLKPILPAELSIAAVNSPNVSVVAGNEMAVAHFAGSLEARGIVSKRLPTSHAFHSHMMDPIVGPFEEVVKSVPLSIPTIPIISTVTGEWMLDSEATDPGYWARHLREPVQFSAAAAKLTNMEEAAVVLEAGPKNSASTLVRQHTTRKDILTIASLDYNSEKGEYYSFVKALGQLWLNGVNIDWDVYYSDQQREILARVPTYAFERKTCWIEPGRPLTTNHPTAGQHLEISDLLQTEVQTLPSAGIIKEQTIQIKEQTILKLTEILQSASGIDVSSLDPECSFLEMGFDSLLLTQLAFTLKKEFDLPITFRQLMEEYSSVEELTNYVMASQAKSLTLFD